MCMACTRVRACQPFDAESSNWAFCASCAMPAAGADWAICRGMSSMHEASSTAMCLVPVGVSHRPMQPVQHQPLTHYLLGLKLRLTLTHYHTLLI